MSIKICIFSYVAAKFFYEAKRKVVRIELSVKLRNAFILNPCHFGFSSLITWSQIASLDSEELSFLGKCVR